jgi:hypothetical protein
VSPHTCFFHLLSAHTVSQTDPPKAGLRCTWPGCPSKTPFRRAYELRRHRKKHGRERMPCTAVNCPRAFYREDKLKAHVYEGHDDRSLFACPVPGCLPDAAALPRYLMAIHCRNHALSTYRNEHTGHLVALEHCDRFRKCPVGHCREKRVVDMRDHLLNGHSLAERLGSASQVGLDGFDALTGHFLCPAGGCCDVYETQDEVFHHFVSSHLERHSRLEVDKHRVLKTIPQLATHPMFDDILPVNDRRAERVP